MERKQIDYMAGCSDCLWERMTGFETVTLSLGRKHERDMQHHVIYGYAVREDACIDCGDKATCVNDGMPFCSDCCDCHNPQTTEGN